MTSLHPRSRPARSAPARQGGGVAVLVALVLAVLVGFAGIVLDLGRLFVNKTELQNAADACALAAASQLVCDPSGGVCPASFLEDAEAAGRFVAARNASDFQNGAVAIAADDIKFHTAIGRNDEYKSRAQGANPNARFVMCTARSAALPTRFMQVLEQYTPAVVRARAVATLAPGQTACNASPIGICSKSATPPNYGYATIGEWIVSSFNQGTGGTDDSNLTGNFRWVDFTSSSGGATEVRDQLLGNATVCGIRVGDDVNEAGVKQGVKSAWNTRFGIYPNGANAPTPASIAPDKTGYAYPSKAPGTVIDLGQSAYADYRSKQATHAPFAKNSYAPSGAAGNVNGDPATQAQHLAYGAERRLIAVPLIECGKSSAKILAMACVLMLNPMSNGASGDLYLEWRGLANAPGSPCRSAGLAGGTTGALVPTLVQ